jgi:hypothetical protein
MRAAVKQNLVNQGLVNHVTFILDRSGSMADKVQAVIAAMDRQVKILADMSTKMNQETRVTVIMFDYEVEVLVYDKDVLRLPSIADVYRTRRGRTALLDATMQGIDDLSKIPHLYGNHANLVYALTDGKENESSHTPSELRRRISSLGDGWTLTTFVPDLEGEELAKSYGFPPGNIMQWDTTSVMGFEDAAAKMESATESWMKNRAAGIHQSKTMFSMDAQSLNGSTISLAGLREIPEDDCMLVLVAPGEPEEYPKICDWVRGAVRREFRVGMVYQELVKTTEVQGTKKIVIVDNGTDRVYGGTQAQVRSLLGLGADNVKISPQVNKKYSVFVQSKSTNRKPVVGQRMLLMLNG